MVWIVYIFRHLCKVDVKYGTLKWYIQLSRLNNMSLLRRTVIFFFFIQVFVLVVCFIIAGSMRAASNCDAGGNDCLDDEEDKETYLERVAKLFNKEFIFEQFLCFFVLFDLYDVIDEENALLNLESSLNCHHKFHPLSHPFCNLFCFSQKMRRLTSWAWGAKGEEWTRGWSLLRLA